MSKGAWKRGDFQGSATRWQSGYSGAGAALAKGVQAPAKDPTAAAIGAVDQLVAGFNAATAGGSNSIWANALRKAGLGSWQSGMAQYAQTGLGQKATKGAPHYLQFASQFGPATMQAVQSLPSRQAVGSNSQRVIDLNNWQHAQRGKYRKLWRG